MTKPFFLKFIVFSQSLMKNFYNVLVSNSSKKLINNTKKRQISWQIVS